MSWEIAVLVTGCGGAVIGALLAFHARREMPLGPAERAIAGGMLGAIATLAIFLLFSGVVGLLYFFGKPRSWWPVILLTWLFAGAFGGGYAFPDTRFNRRS